jgi:hypothetical protein
MPVGEFVEQRELHEAPEELLLTESASVVDSSERAGILERAQAKGITLGEGEELLQIIRPCVGRGKGMRKYTPEVLEADAPNWKGARMFRNHLTETERRRLEGLPRKIEDLAGRIRESWWDGEVPASKDGRFEKGGVYSVIRPTRFIRETLDDDPELIEASISALATSVRTEREGGRTVTVVEGIRPTPRSVDWVTEGGAGGRVLRESAEDDALLMECLTNDEVREWLAEDRPELLEALRAHREGSGNDNRRQEDHVPEITVEQLREALATDEGRALLDELVEAPSLDGYVKTDEVEHLVESRLAERADLIRIEARGDLERQIELRDMRDRAHSLVEAAKLHPRLAKRIQEQFTLTESNEPSDSLAACKGEFDSEGNVVKSAMDVLVEAVSAEITDAKAIQGDLRPTRVRGSGPSTRLVESKGDDDKPGDKPNDDKAKQTTGSSLADELLEGAGISRDALGSLWANGL